MQTLVERGGGRFVPAVRDCQEAVQPGEVAASRLVQQARYVEGRPVRGVDDAQKRQCVEQLRAVVSRTHDGREIRHAGRAADRTEDSRGRPELDDSKVGLPDMRYDRVEHEPLHPLGMRERVPLPDIRAVGDPVQGPAVGAERLTK